MSSSSDYTADGGHVFQVAAVAACVRSRPAGVQLSIRKATRSHLPHLKSHKEGALHSVDVSGLTRVLRVDPARRVIVAQGLVNMGQLVEAALSAGLVPCVVPELRAFTVSGLINGLGVQSSSHRFGTFPDACESFEVVLADGSIVEAREGGPHADLYEGLPGSYGSLGIVTAAVVRCVPALPYVRCRYYGLRSAEEMEYALACACGRADYVDGYMHSASEGVLVVGDFSAGPSPDAPAWDVTPVAEQYYHQHAREMGAREGAAGGGRPPPPPPAGGAPRLSSLATPGGTLCEASLQPAWLEAARRPPPADTMPTEQYLFRLERGFWWQVETFVGLPALTESAWGRAAVGAAVAAEMRALDSAASSASAPPSWSGASGANPAWRPADLHRCTVNQDCVLRLGRAGEGLRYVQARLRLWPLWLCPCLVASTASPMAGAGLRRAAMEEGALGYARGGAPHEGPAAPPPPPRPLPGAPRPPLLMCVDMGVYGEPSPPGGFRHRRDVRALQRFIDAPAAWGMLYLAPEELARTYDLAAYEALRARAGAGAAFAHVTAKIVYHEEGAPDLPPHVLWRLYRRGIRGGVLAALVAAAALALYGGARSAGWQGWGIRDAFKQGVAAVARVVTD